MVILRYGTGLSISRGRSRCFSCDHTLAWFDLIPIVSFISTFGRCRYCSSRLSWQYPAVELLTGALFFITAWQTRDVVNGISILEIISVLVILTIVSIYIAIAVYDLRHMLIPDVFSYTASLVAILYALIITPIDSMFPVLLSGFGAWLFFYLIWRISNGAWMGIGDSKLAISTGFLLGPSGTTSAILMAFWIGAIISLGYMATNYVFKRNGSINMKSEIPFAPFIIIGTLISFFGGVDMGTLAKILTL